MESDLFTLVTALVFLFSVVLGGYALGRRHGRGDEAATFQTGHQAGWLSARRAYLDMQQQRGARLEHNSAGTLYHSRTPHDPDRTLVIPRAR